MKSPRKIARRRAELTCITILFPCDFSLFSPGAVEMNASSKSNALSPPLLFQPLQPSTHAHPSRFRELRKTLTPPRLSTPADASPFCACRAPAQTPSGLYIAPSGPSVVLSHPILDRQTCCGSLHIQQQQSRRLAQTHAVATAVTRPRCRWTFLRNTRAGDTRRVARVCMIGVAGRLECGLIECHAQDRLYGCGFLPMGTPARETQTAGAPCSQSKTVTAAGPRQLDAPTA
jgi:hypothetical protein